MVSFIGNTRTTGRTSSDAVDPFFPFVDMLFDHHKFLTENPDAIGKIPDSAKSTSICIIGAGISGICSAYELLRCGFTNITILEQGLGLLDDKERIGGRLYSKNFPGADADSPLRAEMGAMRFPLSERCAFYYLDKLGIPANGSFPDPGKIPTTLYYKGKQYTWLPGQKSPPPPFNKVHDSWIALITQGWTDNDGKVYKPSSDITKSLKSGDLAQAQIDWQSYINRFTNSSFYAAMLEIFTSDNPPGGVKWTYPEDFEIFGALGVGSGGFGPLYHITFMEFLRLFVNELETDQQFVLAGIETLAQKLADAPVAGTTVRKQIASALVIAVAKDDSGGVKVTYKLNDNVVNKVFDRVIMATTHRAMEIDGNLLASGLVTNENNEAIQSLNLISSSKLFVRTKTKFWLKNGSDYAQNIQSDTLVRGLYCLDYEPNNPDGEGVILINYTWEADANKQQVIGGIGGDLLTKDKRYSRYLETLKEIAPVFAADLEKEVVLVKDANGASYPSIVDIDWQNQQYYYGAFKLGLPGHDYLLQSVYFQFQQALNKDTDTHLYLSADSVNWNAGWIEAGLQSALNAAAAVIQSVGGSFFSDDNPMTSKYHNPQTYNYKNGLGA